MELLINILLISLFCNGLKKSTDEDMILSSVHDRFYTWAIENWKWRKFLYSPTLGCVYCFASFWGIIIHITLMQVYWGETIRITTITAPIVCVSCIFTNGLLFYLLKKHEIQQTIPKDKA